MDGNIKKSSVIETASVRTTVGRLCITRHAVGLWNGPDEEV